MRIGLLIALVLAVGGARASAAPPAPPAPATKLLDLLGSRDPFVRRAAEKALFFRQKEAFGEIHQARDSKDPVRAHAAENVWRAIVLEGSLRAAHRKTPEFWIVLEEVFLRAPKWLQRSILDVALGSEKEVAAVLVEREKAKAVVRDFCLNWNENYIVGDKKTKQKYDALKKRLVDCGAPAAPHLLRILDAYDRRAFLNVDPTLGVSARMQVRAVFGVSFLHLKVALPQLVVLSRSMSLTLSWDAGSLFMKMVNGKLPAFEHRADLKVVDAYFAKHRAEYSTGIRWLTRRLVADLRRSLAGEAAGVPDALETGAVARFLGHADILFGPVDQARMVHVIALLTGWKLDFDEKAPVEKRLAQAREIQKQIDARDWK